MQTRLIRKQTGFPTLCTMCGNRIEPNTTYYLEEGVEEHLHSLVARKFCLKCYAEHVKG